MAGDRELLLKFARKNLREDFKKTISCYGGHIFSNVVTLNPLTPVPPVTARDEPWPFFHF